MPVFRCKSSVARNIIGSLLIESEGRNPVPDVSFIPITSGKLVLTSMKKCPYSSPLWRNM